MRIYIYTYFYLISNNVCASIQLMDIANGIPKKKKTRKREPRSCFLRAEFCNITNPLGGFPVPSGVPSNVRVLVMKLCRVFCHISLLPSWRLMTCLMNERVAGKFVRLCRYRYCGWEAVWGFLTVRFDSHLAGVDNPLDRQLGRYAEGWPRSFKSAPNGSGIDTLVESTCRRWPCWYNESCPAETIRLPWLRLFSWLSAQF